LETYFLDTGVGGEEKLGCLGKAVIQDVLPEALARFPLEQVAQTNGTQRDDTSEVVEPEPLVPAFVNRSQNHLDTLIHVPWLPT